MSKQTFNYSITPILLILACCFLNSCGSKNSKTDSIPDVERQLKQDKSDKSDTKNPNEYLKNKLVSINKNASSVPFNTLIGTPYLNKKVSHQNLIKACKFNNYYSLYHINENSKYTLHLKDSTALISDSLGGEVFISNIFLKLKNIKSFTLNIEGHFMHKLDDIDCSSDKYYSIADRGTDTLLQYSKSILVSENNKFINIDFYNGPYSMPDCRVPFRSKNINYELTFSDFKFHKGSKGLFADPVVFGGYWLILDQYYKEQFQKLEFKNCQ